MATRGARAADMGDLDPGLLLQALTAVKKGDFSVRLPIDQIGVAGKIYGALNDIIESNQRLAIEVSDVADTFGKLGRLSYRASTDGMVGGWATVVNSVNELIDDFVQPTVETARVIGAVANGDLSQRMSLDIDGKPLTGEFLQIGNNVNNMVDHLSTFASEVTRVAREVGTDGNLGGQAQVTGVAGTWKDLTDGVNMMAANLTAQVRNIAEVTTAVARAT